MSIAQTVGSGRAPTEPHSCYESAFALRNANLLLARAVIDVEADAEGRLRPRAGATIRSEPARGEAVVHRRLAELVYSPDAGAPALTAGLWARWRDSRLA